MVRVVGFTDVGTEREGIPSGTNKRATRYGTARHEADVKTNYLALDPPAMGCQDVNVNWCLLVSGP